MDQATRAPIVVVLGHVDAGKTSILDYIRKTRVAEKEVGGITQHIGAYQIVHQNKKITFIDTPGHEAFSAMRTRGAKVADIAILVVDSTQGVQAQTKEAITQAKLANIPIIVALNKIDHPDADPEKAKRELQKERVLIEEFGGKVPVVTTSAKTGQGIEELLELILLLAEMENLSAEISGPTEGVVIEAYLDSKRGPIATLILSQGELKLGDILATSSTLGKVKSLEDFQGKRIERAEPSQPVCLIGFEKVPKVGEKVKTFSNFEQAKISLIAEKKNKGRVLEIKPEQKVLNLILKADVLGSTEAIEEILKTLPQEKVILRFLKSEAGEINPNDIELAKSGRAFILGFRTKINPLARDLAQREKIKIINFEIIYDLVEGVRKLMEKTLEPEIIRIDLGKIKALVDFWSEKNRQIVGGKVIEGEIKKGALIEILRGDKIIGQGKMVNLQRDKRDIEKAKVGEEVGILYEGEQKIEKGDILIIYTKEKKNISKNEKKNCSG